MFVLRMPLLIIGVLVLGIILVVIAIAQVLDNAMEPTKQTRHSPE